MLDVRIEVPQQKWRSLLRAVDPKAVTFAETQALNRAAANGRSKGIELVAKAMGIGKTKLRKRGRQADFRGGNKHGAFSQTKRATRRQHEAVLSGFGRPFNINRWKNTPIHSGSSTNIQTRVRRRERSRQVIGVTHNAWNDTKTIGNVWRLSNGAYVTRTGNTFRSVYGPGVTHVLEYPEVSTPLIEHIQERFEHHFDQAIDYALSSQSHIR